MNYKGYGPELLSFPNEITVRELLVTPEGPMEGPVIVQEYNTTRLPYSWYGSLDQVTSQSIVWTPLNRSLLGEIGVAAALNLTYDGPDRVLLAVLYVRFIEMFFSSLTLPYNGRIIIVDDQGRLVADSAVPLPNATYYLGDLGGLYSELADAVVSQYGSFDQTPNGATFQIGDWLASIQVVQHENLTWIVIVLVSYSSLLHQVIIGTIWAGVSLGIMLVISFLLAGWLGIRITSPVKKIDSRLCKMTKMEFPTDNRQTVSHLAEIRSMQQQVDKLEEALLSFQKFVPPQVVKNILSSAMQARLGMTEQVATVLFCDVEGFTTLAERLRDSPNILVSVLEDMFEELTRIIQQKKGDVDKYIGDAAMVNIDHTLCSLLLLPLAGVVECFWRRS